ncbi:hypothetical protein [Negativibacillus massiliensis]|uniref:hypothetical protein n=1 Tax=Negativibacillus massiliensis TaxID=1871035 RepID=UPI003AF2A24E
MFELMILAAVLFGGMILLPIVYEVSLWIHHRRCIKKLRTFEQEVRKRAEHDREAS